MPGEIPRDQPIRVDCYAGTRGGETPRRAWVAERWAALTVLDRWMSEDARRGTRIRWFRVRFDGEREGLIYHDEGLDLWFCEGGLGVRR